MTSSTQTKMSDLKVGDEIAIQYPGMRVDSPNNYRLATVTRVTPKRIWIGQSPYKRDSGAVVGYGRSMIVSDPALISRLQSERDRSARQKAAARAELDRLEASAHYRAAAALRSIVTDSTGETRAKHLMEKYTESQLRVAIAALETPR